MVMISGASRGLIPLEKKLCKRREGGGGRNLARIDPMRYSRVVSVYVERRVEHAKDGCGVVNQSGTYRKGVV